MTSPRGRRKSRRDQKSDLIVLIEQILVNGKDLMDNFFCPTTLSPDRTVENDKPPGTTKITSGSKIRSDSFNRTNSGQRERSDGQFFLPDNFVTRSDR